MINCLNTNNYVSPLTNSSKHNDNEQKGKKHQAAQENVAGTNKVHTNVNLQQMKSWAGTVRQQQ